MPADDPIPQHTLPESAIRPSDTGDSRGRQPTPVDGVEHVEEAAFSLLSNDDIQPRPDTPESGTLAESGLPAFMREGTASASEFHSYELGAEIARGGMGVVHTAWDVGLGREVAVKTVRPEYAKAVNARAMFEREARITGALPHPNIPPVHALGNLPDGRPFLAMKFVKGITLAAILPAFDTASLLRIFEQVCQAVAFAHSRGIIHRDLKPDNVMVGEFSEVQVMDWGLARKLGSDEFSEPTSTIGHSQHSKASDADPVS